MNRKLPFFASVAFVTILLLSYSCVDHDFGAPHFVDCSGAKAYSYNLEVNPIITNKCAVPDCHDGSNPDLPDWTVLSNLQNSDNKKEIKRRITLPDTDGDKMPKEGTITQEERQAIYCWIEQGAQDN